MRAIPAAELARITDGTGRWRFRVEVRRPGDAEWTNLSDGAYGDWVLGVRTDGATPDAPATGAVLRFLPKDGDLATAPGMAGSALNRVAGLLRPILYPGRAVRVWAACDAPDEIGAAPWRLWLDVEVEDVKTAPDAVEAHCQTLDAKLEATFMTVEEEGGAPDPGRPVEDEIQSVLTRWAPWAGTIRVVGTPDWSIGPYPRGKISAGALVRSLAQKNAWDFRRWWSDVDAAYRFTLQLPPRDKAVPDLVLGASQVHESGGATTSRRDVRNDFALDYHDASGAPQTAVRENGTEEPPTGSIGDYGRRAMVLDETGPESPIRSAAQADALLAYADHDLSEPLTDRTVVLPFLPWLELHDLLEVAADGVEYDFPGRWAVTSVSHTVDATEGARTEVGLRGDAPVGMYYAWLARQTGDVPEPPVPRLHNLRAVRYEADQIVFAAAPSEPTTEVLIFSAQHPLPIPGDPWPKAGPPFLTVPVVQVGAEIEFALPIPLLDWISFSQVEPRGAAGEGGPIWRIQVFGTRDVVITPPGPPVVHPPLAPPAWVAVERAEAGDCATGAPAAHRVTWEGAGLLYYQGDDGVWRRPPGAPLSFDDSQPFVLPILGGGYVIDEAAGTPTEIRYRVTRRGASGTNASTEESVVEPLRRCDAGGGGAVTIDGQLDADDVPGDCTVRDVLSWSAGGFVAAEHRVEYQLLDRTLSPTSGWLAVPPEHADSAAGTAVLDVHAGRISSKLEPEFADETLVDYGARLRVVHRASGATIALGTDLMLRYVVEPCA